MLNNLAVIILNYNTAKQTIQLTKRLNAWGYYVVVVDNASTDNSTTEIEDELKNLGNCDFVFSKENGGYAKGNNLGIRIATKNRDCDYIAIMNPDIELFSKNTLFNLCSTLSKDDKLAGITALTVFNNEFYGKNPCATRLLRPYELIYSDVFLLNRFVKRNYADFKVNQDFVAYAEKLQGCFFVMKKSIFESIDYFDENTFLYFEEDIIGAKIRDEDLKLGVLLSETIRHNHGIKDNEMTNRNKRIFYNKCFLHSKKYYMLSILKVPRIVWRISYVLDSTTRKVKDVFCR